MPDKSRISRSKLVGIILLLVVYLSLTSHFIMRRSFDRRVTSSVSISGQRSESRLHCSRLSIHVLSQGWCRRAVYGGLPYLNLILDLMIGLGSAGLMVGYLWYLARRTPSSAPHKIRRFSLADTLLLVGIVAAVLGQSV